MFRSSMRHVALVVALLLSGCQLLAPYSQADQEATLQSMREVVEVYDRLAQVPEGARRYDRFADDYARVESGLVVLSVRAHAREHNEDSAEIADAILQRWRDMRAQHRKRSARASTAGVSYPDSQVGRDRDHFVAMFTHMIGGEAAKEGAPAAASGNKSGA